MQDRRSLSTDPLFHDPANGDFHERSVAGRYQVDCYVDGRRFDTTNDSFNLPANGSTRLGCYYGGYGNVYAKIIGWGDTSGVNW